MEQLADVQRLGLRLRDGVLQINQSILEKAKQQRLQTASTMSALLVAEERYYVVHVGDSRIYSYCDGVLEQLTCDQVSEGKFTSCLGRTQNPLIIYNEGLCNGNRFLLCSDGLFKRTDLALLQMELAQAKKKTLKKTAER